MMMFYLVLIIYLVLMLLPILISVFSSRRKEALKIQPDNVKDPRYFANSFIKLIGKAMEKYDGSNMLNLSRKEAFIEGNGRPFRNEKFDLIVYEKEHDFYAENCIFEKEIFAGKNAELDAGTEIRAIACMQKLTLGDKTVVHRWADGIDSCTVGEDCELGISVSSDVKLAVGKNCMFRRLYAPVIRIGELQKNTVAFDFSVNVNAEREDYWDHVDAHTVLEKTVVSTGELTVKEGCTIYGSVKANGDLRICKGTFISGSVFADGTLVLEDGVRVYGHVFSQKQVFIGYDCAVGMEGHIKSIIGRDGVVLSERITVFGYVATEGEGKTIAADDFYDAVSNIY